MWWLGYLRFRSKPVIELVSRVREFRWFSPCGSGNAAFSSQVPGAQGSRKRLPFEVDVRVDRDVLLYKYENVRYFRLLSLFAFSQCFFWSYLAHFAFTSLRDVRKKEAKVKMNSSSGDSDGGLLEEPQALAWWRRVNLGQNKYRWGLTTLCLSIGCLIMTASTFYTLRSVKYLTLLKGGQTIRLSCYSPWLASRMITVPLDHLSCSVSRGHGKNQIPLKVRGYRMYFLLDRDGTFPDAKLFDQTAGLQRNW